MTFKNDLLGEYVVCREVPDVLSGFSFEWVEYVYSLLETRMVNNLKNLSSLSTCRVNHQEKPLKSECYLLYPPSKTTYTLNNQWIQDKGKVQLKQNKPNVLHIVEKGLQSQRKELDDETISYVLLSFYNVTLLFY